MIYFKSISIAKADNLIIEKAIRNYSLKRHGALDFKQSSSYVTEDNKYFLGQETEKYINITRLRTPFENFLPKLILRFDKNRFNFYQIRFSFLSNIVCIVLLFALVLNLIKLITSGEFRSNVAFILFFSIVFVLMTMIEIFFTTKKLKKAINKEDLSIEQIIGN